MKLGYISDLHCEFTDGNMDVVVPPKLDVLVLAGDIHNRPKGTRLAIKQLRDKTDAKILYVLGNHEYYNQIFPSVRKQYNNQVKKLNQVWLLECDERIIDGVRFLGTTLWSDLSNPHDAAAVMRSMNDCRIVFTSKGKLFLPSDITDEWKRCYKWLEKKLHSKFDGPTVVITHHSPSPITCAPCYQNSSIKAGFHSNTSDLVINYGPDVWIYGHDHMNSNHRLGKTKLISNQVGYPHEKLSRIIKTVEV